MRCLATESIQNIGAEPEPSFSRRSSFQAKSQLRLRDTFPWMRLHQRRRLEGFKCPASSWILRRHFHLMDSISLTDNYGPIHPSAARGISIFFVTPWPLVHFEKLLVLLEHVLNDPGPRPCLVFGIIEGNGNIWLFPLKLALIRWQRFSEIRGNNCCTIWVPDLRASQPYRPNRRIEIWVIWGCAPPRCQRVIFLLVFVWWRQFSNFSS